jgi:hypothetical protein
MVLLPLSSFKLIPYPNKDTHEEVACRYCVVACCHELFQA